jgi:arsenate reductase
MPTPAPLARRQLAEFLGSALPASVPGFIAAQAIGGAIAMLTIRTLYPDLPPAAAAEVALPHGT